MARAGRPRKTGQRYKCGKRTPTAIQDDMRRVALEARMRIFGVSREDAGKDVIGSPLGRLLHWKLITQAQVDAGYDFALTMREYLAGADSPRPTQGKASFLPSLRSSSDSAEPTKGETKARAYMEALRDVDALDFRALTATSVVWDVCISENDRMRDEELGQLRAGLNAIGRVMYKGIMAKRAKNAA